jgi:hypothetical protein
MLCVQRFAASSLFKRTIYQHIAEELLAAGHAASPAVSCPIDSRARPLITLPTESPLQRLFTSLDFEDEAVDRHKLAAGLQRLGGAPYAMQCNAPDMLLAIGFRQNVKRSSLLVQQSLYPFSQPA